MVNPGGAAAWPYRHLSGYLQARFGERIQKITLDAGLTCPNRDGTVGRGGCIYCNARGSGTGAASQGQSITAQLQVGMDRLRRRYGAQKFIAYFQSFSNTYGPLPLLQSLYEEALAFPQVVGLSIGTRPDCLTPAVLELLASWRSRALIWLELGLQSAHDRTLALINRGHDVACFVRGVELAVSYGLEVVAHVILGLPGEGREEMLATARFLSRLPLAGVKIHLLYIIRGTRMAELLAAGAYRPLGRQEYVDLVVDFLELLPPELVIHRLTGDPHPQELLAPSWCLDKAGVLADIRQAFQRRGTFQGRLFADGRERQEERVARTYS